MCLPGRARPHDAANVAILLPARGEKYGYCCSLLHLDSWFPRQGPWYQTETQGRSNHHPAREVEVELFPLLALTPATTQRENKVNHACAGAAT